MSDATENLCLLLLAQLDDEVQRNVVVRYYIGGLTESAIGIELGVGRERVHRIRRTAEDRMRRFADLSGLSDLAVA